MAPPEKQSGSSGITGTLAAVGIACGFIGAVVGAFGWDLWKKEKMHSGKPYNTGQCPICLSDMEELTVLPCGHQYHSTCVENLKKNASDEMTKSADVQGFTRRREGELKCPVCRKIFDK